MSKRFKASNAHKLLPFVKQLDPNAKLVPPSTSFAGGCGDPDCCIQHTGFIGEEQALEIQTTLSATKLNKIFKKHIDNQTKV